MWVSLSLFLTLLCIFSIKMFVPHAHTGTKKTLIRLPLRQRLQLRLRLHFAFHLSIATATATATVE